MTKGNFEREAKAIEGKHQEMVTILVPLYVRTGRTELLHMDEEEVRGLINYALMDKDVKLLPFERIQRDENGIPSAYQCVWGREDKQWIIWVDTFPSSGLSVYYKIFSETLMKELSEAPQEYLDQ